MNWRVFIGVLGVKLLQNNQSLRNFCLWGCKAAGLLLVAQFFCFMWKKALITWSNHMLTSYLDLHHHICQMPCHGILEHQNFEFFYGRIPWNPVTGPHPKDTWMRVFGNQTASNFHVTCSRKTFWEGCTDACAGCNLFVMSIVVMSIVLFVVKVKFCGISLVLNNK